MRLNPSFKIHKIGSHYMIVDTVADNSNLANVYTLNEAAGLLWLEVEGRDFTADDLVGMLADNYEVEPSQARCDVDRLLENWEKYGFLLP